MDSLGVFPCPRTPQSSSPGPSLHPPHIGQPLLSLFSPTGGTVDQMSEIDTIHYLWFNYSNTYLSIVEIVGSRFQDGEDDHGDGCSNRKGVGIMIRNIFLRFCPKSCYQEVMPLFDAIIWKNINKFIKHISSYTTREITDWHIHTSVPNW